MDQEEHWNKIGGKYDGEIFDVFKSDKNGKLPFCLKKHANPAHHAIDFGCGMGKAFPYLAPSFAHVLAIDISSGLLSMAKLNGYKNITYKRADLTNRNLSFPPADFVFCCNVIMLPEAEKNVAMIQNIHKALRPNGHALIVVPSMESVLFSSWRMIDWYKKEGVDPIAIPNSELHYYKAAKRDLLQGIIHIDGIPTKHFSAPEIDVLFNDARLTITAIEKLEYEWNTEFAAPPVWMKAPYPWDWLIECRR
jgi:SAM-dependent methyltransferase